MVIQRLDCYEPGMTEIKKPSPKPYGFANSTGSDNPTDLFTDNQSVLALSKNPVSHARAKHIDVRHHFVHDAIQNNVIWVQHIPTEDMTADSLTKALGREKHWKCTTRMGMC